MSHSDAEPALESLIERSAELKRALIDFALSPRFDRQLAPFILDASGPDGELDESEAIRIIDTFALQYRLPNGKTIVDLRPCPGSPRAGDPGTDDVNDDVIVEQLIRIFVVDHQNKLCSVEHVRYNCDM